MRDQLKCTTIVVTHDTRSMRRVGNRVMLLHHGEIHANGTPDEIFNSTDPIVHKFVNGIADPKDLEF
jgi:phospholipid/cholesterol/gamma-HCH transport system ATP-binding protein